MQRARLLVPPTPPERLLILLHGRGEAHSEALALDAWPKSYGLDDAVRRLHSPPVGPVLRTPKLDPARKDRINRELAARPFKGFAILCPVTPNPAKHSDRDALFDAYAAWLFEVLVPHVRSKLPSLKERLGLDGCSMGGYVAWEVLLRRPEALDTFGTVQAAFGAARGAHYADAVAAMPVRPHMHILTSSNDTFVEANTKLSKELTRRGIGHDFDAPDGPHDQPWLRQIGTLEMLLWHDRAL